MHPRHGTVLKAFLLVVMSLAWSGCTHWVVIRSSPAGAKARMDGVEMGNTPFFFEETTGWSKVYRLELEKEGFEPTAVTLTQNEMQMRNACPSVCLCPFTFGLSLVGCAWSYGLADEYHFVMVPLDDSLRPAPQGDHPPTQDGGRESGPDGSPPADIPKKDEEQKPVLSF